MLSPLSLGTYCLPCHLHPSRQPRGEPAARHCAQSAAVIGRAVVGGLPIAHSRCPATRAYHFAHGPAVMMSYGCALVPPVRTSPVTTEMCQYLPRVGAAATAWLAAVR